LLMSLAAPRPSAAESWSAPASCSDEACIDVRLDDDAVVARPANVGEVDAITAGRERDASSGSVLAPRMPTREDETASAVMLAEAADAEAWLDVHIAVDIELQSKRALLEGVTGASDDDRLARIETIELEAEMLLAPVEAMVTAAGAKVLGRLWLGQPGLAVPAQGEAVYLAYLYHSGEVSP